MWRWASRTLAPSAALGCVFALAALAALAGIAPAASAAPRPGKLQLVLPLNANVAGLERLAAAVTTIGSPMYGDFEPLPTLERRFGASASTRARVIRYLRHAGATNVRIDATGLFADATLAAPQARRLFAADLGRYHGARIHSPTAGARVPAALGGAVTGVVGLDTRPVLSAPDAIVANPSHFPRTAAHVSPDGFPSGYSARSGTANGCGAALGDRGFTPNQYLTAYDYGKLQAAGTTGQGERVALIEIDGFRYSDVKAFAGCFGLRVPAINGYGVGIKRALAPGGETTLDLELMDAAAPGLKEIDVYESGQRAADVLQSLSAPLENRGHVPQVISASLGTCEPALAVTIGLAGARTAEGTLAMAAASGISVVAASGDAGSSACIGDGAPLDRLAVSYPASSPYVTAVGGTNVNLTAANQIQGETVWNDAPYDITAGGGGLSGMFARPSYQDGFVARNRRALPDISMLADVLPGYDIYCTAKECLSGGNHDPWISVGGTSAAAPLFAGGLTLVDQLLREHHKQDVGLANPLLYEIDRAYASSGALLDVTTGDNDLGAYLPGSGGRPLGCCSAGPGYDYASGLGSIDLGKLAALATALQPGIANVALALPGQQPVKHHRLLATVSCSNNCIATVVATVSAQGARPFVVRSDDYVLRGAGRRTLKLKLSKAELGVLRKALHDRKSVSATVVGQVVDSGGNVEAATAAQTLQITS